MDERDKCENCGCPLDEETGLCAECDDPAPKWLVYLVYALAGMFLAGLVYRLIWP